MSVWPCDKSTIGYSAAGRCTSYPVTVARAAARPMDVSRCGHGPRAPDLGMMSPTGTVY